MCSLQVKCVLVGFDPDISYMKLIRAASYLKKPDCIYLATNEDSSFPSTNPNISIPGMSQIFFKVKPCALLLQVQCVLVGFDPYISYMKLIRAASYLKKPDCLFLATNRDGSLPVKNANICIPGTIVFDFFQYSISFLFKLYIL